MIKVFTDGGSRGNPGPSASAFVVYKGDEMLHQEGKYLGTSTNNIAEYKALELAVEWLNKNGYVNNVTFYLDSELIVKQLTKVYKVKNEKLKIIYIQIVNTLRENFENYSFKHVPRVHNEKADNIVNFVLNENK